MYIYTYNNKIFVLQRQYMHKYTFHNQLIILSCLNTSRPLLPFLLCLKLKWRPHQIKWFKIYLPLKQRINCLVSFILEKLAFLRKTDCSHKIIRHIVLINATIVNSKLLIGNITFLNQAVGDAITNMTCLLNFDSYIDVKIINRLSCTCLSTIFC